MGGEGKGSENGEQAHHSEMASPLASRFELEGLLCSSTAPKRGASECVSEGGGE